MKSLSRRNNFSAVVGRSIVPFFVLLGVLAPVVGQESSADSRARETEQRMTDDERARPDYPSARLRPRIAGFCFTPLCLENPRPEGAE